MTLTFYRFVPKLDEIVSSIYDLILVWFKITVAWVLLDEGHGDPLHCAHISHFGTSVSRGKYRHMGKTFILKIQLRI